LLTRGRLTFPQSLDDPFLKLAFCLEWLKLVRLCPADHKPLPASQERLRQLGAFGGCHACAVRNAIDERCPIVVGIGSLANGLVTSEMQQRIAARDDWAFAADETTFVAICREPFATAEQVSQRVSEVLGIIAAVPASIAPAQVDHSVDDLLVRIARIDDVDDALAFLQQLSDADRQRLAASPTPLAKFADVRTPDEAIARLMSLPDMERLQVLAMFEKADGG